MKLQLAIVVLIAASSFAAKARYDNYKLYSMQLQNEEQAKVVVELEQNTDAYDFWSAVSLVRDVDVMVPPHKLGEFEDFLNRFDIPFHIKVENIQKYNRKRIECIRIILFESVHFSVDSLINKTQN